jgi:hypothetical protein
MPRIVRDVPEESRVIIVEMLYWEEKDFWISEMKAVLT